MNYVEQSVSSPVPPSGPDLNINSQKSLVHDALEANKNFQRILIQRAEKLEARLKEADQLLAAATVEESQDEPESEILIPGAKKATGLVPSTEFLNPASPFFEEATKRSSYITNTNPHPFKTKDIETLSAAVRQENERLQAYTRSQDLSSGSGQPIDLEKNTEGLDWSKIAEKVSDASSVKRTAVECQIIWIADKHPAVNHAEWSEDELNKLNLLVSHYTKEKMPVDWVKVAENLGTNRIPIDCMRHGIPRHRHNWSPETDQKLVQAVESCGQDNWQLVARKVSENVSAAQCQNRWQRTLNPILRKGAWTEDEDERLRKAVAGYGPSWIQVAVAIPGRTNDQCRERWTEYLSNASAKIIWTEEEDKILLDSVKERGNQWKVISLKIGNNKTGQNCRMRYDKLKRMKDNPQADSSASTTTFINSTLSQSAEGQRSSAHDAAASSPTANSHGVAPRQESEPIAPRARARSRAKGKRKEKEPSLNNTYSSDALQPSESSNTTTLMDVSEETITTTATQPNQPVSIANGGSQEPLSKPRPRPRPKAKGKASENVLLQSGTPQSKAGPNRSSAANERQLIATILAPGSSSMADTLSTTNSKRKAVDEADSMDGSQPKRMKASHAVEPQPGSLQPSQIPPALASMNVDSNSTLQLVTQPKKRGRPRKVRPPTEQEQPSVMPIVTPVPLISTASQITSLRRTRAQTREAQRHLESSS